MKAVQLTRAALKTSTSSFPFLLPAFATTPALLSTQSIQRRSSTDPRLWSSRCFSISASQRADPSATEPFQDAGRAQSSHETTEPASKGGASSTPHSRNAISDTLGDIIGRPSATRLARSSSRLATLQRGEGSVGERQGLLASEMGLGLNPGLAGGPGGLLYVRSNGFSHVPEAPLPKRLDAFVGRSEPVKGRGALAAAMRNLEIKITSNKVRMDHIAQKFHERPGLKRKRLKSQRWRKRFKEGFAATVRKVIYMKNMGW